ncbi:MAG: TSUP family transporter [bacterium]|nr:TSUP family transporter [bacterium]
MEKLIILTFGMFFTGIMDAVAGEGGMLSTPLLIMAGLPPITAVASNKAIAMMGNIATCTGFIRGKKVKFSKLKCIIPVMLIGTAIGIEILKVISNQFMGKFVPVTLLFLVFFIIFIKDTGLKDRNISKSAINSIITLTVLFIIGIYDGFYGAAAGAFMSMTFMFIYGFNIVDSLATSRFINLLICITSTVMLIPSGLLDIKIILIASGGRMVGGYFGSYIAITRGAKFIKPIFLIAVIIAIFIMFFKYY